MKVTQTSTTSTDTLPRRTPGASGHQPSGLGPRPAFPAQAPAVKHLAHDLPHIPTAGPAPVPAYDDAWGRPSAWAAF